MAMTMHVDIVSLETEIFSGRAQMLSVTGIIGELGIAPSHAPLLTQLKPGPVRVKLQNGEEEVYYISGGMLEVQPDVVTILADTAVRANDIDEAAALEAKEQAERALKDREAELDYSMAQAELARAVAQLRVLKELRKIRDK